MAKPIEGVRITKGADWWKHLRKYSKRKFNKSLRKQGRLELKLYVKGTAS
jgi:hypothetical protein